MQCDSFSTELVSSLLRLALYYHWKENKTVNQALFSHTQKSQKAPFIAYCMRQNKCIVFKTL